MFWVLGQCYRQSHKPDSSTHSASDFQYDQAKLYMYQATAQWYHTQFPVHNNENDLYLPSFAGRPTIQFLIVYSTISNQKWTVGRPRNELISTGIGWVWPASKTNTDWTAKCSLGAQIWFAYQYDSPKWVTDAS